MRTKALMILWAAVSAALSGCIKDKDFSAGPAADGTDVAVTFRVPGQAAVNTAGTRVMGIADENRVESIDMLAFNEDGSFAYAYHTAAIKDKSETTPKEKVCKVQIQRSKNAGKFSFVFLANMPDGYVSSLAGGFTAGTTTKAQVLAAITFSGTNYYGGDGKWKSAAGSAAAFPMWGEHAVVTVDNDLTGLSTVHLTRAVARIDVGLNFSSEFSTEAGDYGKTQYEAAGLTGFELLKVRVYKVNTSGYAAPQGANWTVAPKLPSIQTTPSTQGYIEYSAPATGNKHQIIREIYLAESKVAGKAADERTCLLIQGKYKGGSATWYRLDFYERGAQKNKLLDILRNHRYVVNITGVNGDGYTRIEDALISDPINMEGNVVTLSEDGDFDTVVADGQNYLAVSPREFTFAADGTIMAPSTDNTLYIKTDAAGGWKIDTGGIVYTPSGTNWLTFSATFGAGDGTKQTVTLAATANAGLVRTATFHVTAGRLRVPVTVTQRELSVPTLTVTGAATTAAYAHSGGSKAYSVSSYITRGGTSTAVAWTAEFSTDDGATWTTTKPSWLTTFTTSGAGSETATDYNATVQAFPATRTNAEDLALKEVSAVGTTAAPYDLSTKGSTNLANRNTANCYVINAPGYYKLPLVYGNAIKNGTTNTSSYSTTSGTNRLTAFLRHDNGAITNPYLYNNSGVVPANATLVWMDASGLISNVRLVDSNQSLAFDVPAGSIAQGNAIVAVRNSSNAILWSWHIWVTPTTIFDAANPQTDATKNRTAPNTTFNFMKYNLGWCTGSTIKYGDGINNDQPRSVQVRISQAGIENPLTASPFTVEQKNYTSSDKGTGPYWQWGRKDPMPPRTVSRTLYFDDSYSYVASPPGSASLGIAIQNPNRFYTVSSNSPSESWCSTTYYNLWGANTSITPNTNIPVKTVYDPSPVGFVMPPSGAWTGFILAGHGSGSTNTSHFNISGDWDNGWNFYTGLEKTGDTAFYPATSFRHHMTGAIGSDVNRYASNDQALGIENSACVFSFLSYILDTVETTSCAVACPVRSVKE